MSKGRPPRNAASRTPAQRDALADALVAGRQLHQAGRLGEAEEICRQVLRRSPNNADALHLLGRIALQSGNLPVAAGLVERAVELRPRSVAYRCSLATVLRMQGRTEGAIDSYRRALKLDPACLEAHNNLGNLLQKIGEFEVAVRHLERALALRPDSALAHNNLAITLHRAGHIEKAGEHYRRALQLDAGCAEAYFNLGNLQKDCGNLADAVASYEKAFDLELESAEARLNLAEALLLLGRFEHGWEQYEHRAVHAGRSVFHKGGARPLWQGDALEGRTILLHREQGAGDTIQFARFVPMVAARGARVILEVTADLTRLLSRVPGAHSLLVMGEPRPEFDVQCPLPSLPRAFAVGAGNIPAAVPYLEADPALVARWDARLAAARGTRVGLVWAGSPTHRNDRSRSMPFAALEPLASVAGTSFISLQTGAAAAQALHPGALQPEPLGPELADFADTAAVLTQLDLVITVDTSVAHLAGAMGKATLVMLPADPDWRWMLEREDSPWYPTLRLFRQSRRGDWGEVVERVRNELAARRI